MQPTKPSVLGSAQSLTPVDSARSCGAALVDLEQRDGVWKLPEHPPAKLMPFYSDEAAKATANASSNAPAVAPASARSALISANLADSSSGAAQSHEAIIPERRQKSRSLTAKPMSFATLWVANSCSRSDWQLEKPGAMGLELLIFDHFPRTSSGETLVFIVLDLTFFSHMPLNLKVLRLHSNDET